MGFKNRSTLSIVGIALLSALNYASCDNDLIYVLDIVNHGSALPVNYMGMTGVNYPYTGPG